MILQLGEIREVGIEVINQLSEDFVIEAAEYQIVSKAGAEIEKGFPSINGHKLIALFKAVEKGVFYIIFKYHIGPEILKTRISVEVTN